MIEIYIPNVGWVDFDLRPIDIRMAERKHGCLVKKLDSVEVLEDLGWAGLKRSDKVQQSAVTMPGMSYAGILDLFLIPCRCVIAGITIEESKSDFLKAAEQSGATPDVLAVLAARFVEKRREKATDDGSGNEQ